MSHSQFGRGEAGVNTVEGNLAGRRAAQLAKKREKDQLEFEAKKRKIQDEHQRGLGNIDQKFKSIAHDAFHLDFVGLKTKEEFKVLKDAAEEEFEKKRRKEDLVKKKELEDKKRKKEKAKKASRLSFAVRDEEDGEEAEATFTKKEPTKKALKNPEVETSFLPDPHQEREEEALRQRLKQEWLEEQERIKNELLEVTYSYWDGSGHRRVIKLNKGTTIGKFLEQVKQQLSQEFSDVRAISPDDLMYIKEDLIIPHNFSFYDLIVTKARGKSGPLFHFDVHDDVRIVHDSRIEKDESHPGKVVDRKWYERNKHIFPASRWEVYDPKVQRAHPYTIHGHEIHGKKQKDNE